MANTYTQLYIHIIFSVKQRTFLIKDEWREELHKYITGIIQNKGHKMLAVNSMPDHVHIFIGMKPHECLSDLVRDIKASSSKWINERKPMRGKFSWQEGYGAFTCSHSEIGRVAKYIQNQQEHHKKTTFRKEYLSFLKSWNVSHDLKFVFDIEEEAS